MSNSTSTTTPPPLPQQQQQQQQGEGSKSEYQRTIEEIAKRGVYEFTYVEGPKAGQTVQLERNKISVAKMVMLEKLRAGFNLYIAQYQNKEKVEGAAAMTKEERLRLFTDLIEVYAKLAEFYFGITREEFDMLDYDSVRPNCDAASEISLRGRPN